MCIFIGRDSQKEPLGKEELLYTGPCHTASHLMPPQARGMAAVLSTDRGRVPGPGLPGHTRIRTRTPRRPRATSYTTPRLLCSFGWRWALRALPSSCGSCCCWRRLPGSWGDRCQAVMPPTPYWSSWLPWKWRCWPHSCRGAQWAPLWVWVQGRVCGPKPLPALLPLHSVLQGASALCK